MNERVTEREMVGEMLEFFRTVKLEMQVKRLNLLADFLDQLPQAQLKMETWYCNSAACAAGWATRLPVFQQEGFTESSFALASSDPLDPKYAKAPQYRDSFGWTAVREFFGLDRYEVWAIFSAECYDECCGIEPKEVARRIRQVIAYPHSAVCGWGDYFDKLIKVDISEPRTCAFEQEQRDFQAFVDSCVEDDYEEETT